MSIWLATFLALADKGINRGHLALVTTTFEEQCDLQRRIRDVEEAGQHFERCAKCRSHMHATGDCQKAARIRLAMRNAKPRTCRRCGRGGHYRTTCNETLVSRTGGRP